MAITGLIALGQQAAGQLGTVTYNDFSFGATRKATLVGEPVYDDADRVVTHIKYRLTVHAFVLASSVALENAAMDNLQDRLTVPGRRLVISNVGFDAGIDTQLGGVTPDMIFGAKPRLLQFVENSGGTAWEIVWQCEFNVSRCNDAHVRVRQKPVPWLAFNYDAVYSVSEEGLLVRIISGYVQIPLVRGVGGNPALLQNLDSTWDRLTVAVPYGFARGERTRRLNEAKNRLEFSIVDRELPGEIFPNGIIRAEGDYDFESTGGGFVQWVASLNMSLTVAPGYPASLAGLKFFAILFDKVTRLTATVKRRDKKAVVIPTKIKIGHSLWTRTSRFSVQYMVVSCLHEILTSSGVWAPLPEGSWNTWSDSMVKAGVWDNRGVSGLMWDERSDAVVDLCQGLSGYRLGLDGRTSRQRAGNGDALLRCPEVSEEASWINYANKLHLIENAAAVVHTESRVYDPQRPPSRVEGAIVQYQAEPEVLVLVTGYGDRVGFKVDVPALLSYGGLPAIELARNVVIDDTPSGAFIDCPLYRGRWSILYRIPGLTNRTSSDNIRFASGRPAPLACGLTQQKK